MTKRTDLDDVLDGLIFPMEKISSDSSLSDLSLFELEALMDLQEKTSGNGDPLREKMKRLGQLKKKQAEDVEYTGQVNNGVPSAPEWPRAALGVDAAGRKATPEERREQLKTVTPDVQHVEPHSDGEQFVTKGAAGDADGIGDSAKPLNSAKKMERSNSRTGRYEDRYKKHQETHELTPDAARAILSTRPSGVKHVFGGRIYADFDRNRREAARAFLENHYRENPATSGESPAKISSLKAILRDKQAQRNAPTVDHLEKNMKPGDIVLMTPQPLADDAGLLTRMGGSVFGAVSGAIQGKYTHAGIYAGNGNIIDIRSETGVRKVPLKSITKDLSVAVVRPKLHARARRQAVEKAESYYKNRDQIKYHVPDLIPAAASAFMDIGEKPINENQVICSSMVANAFGKHKVTPGVARHATKPVDFLNSPRVKYIGDYDTNKVSGMNDALGMRVADVLKHRASQTAAKELASSAARKPLMRVSDIIGSQPAAAAAKPAAKSGPFSARNRDIARQMQGADPSRRAYLAGNIVV